MQLDEQGKYPATVAPTATAVPPHVLTREGAKTYMRQVFDLGERRLVIGRSGKRPESLLRTRRSQVPRMLAMLGQVSGKAMLDLGCGEGGYARELGRRGAHVTAVDGSARLIEVARQRARAEGVDVRFVHANANALHEVESGRFDVVVAPMSHRGMRGGGYRTLSIIPISDSNDSSASITM